MNHPLTRHSLARLLTAALAAVIVSAAPAAAQSVGIGPRMSFVRGHVPSGTPSTSLFGGSLRFVQKHTAIELSMDMKTVYSPDRTLRTRETPIQMSLLLYPVRAAVAPYLLGGFGIYRQTLDSVDPSGEVIAGVKTQKTGIHLGGGLEILFSRHVGIYGDYRFRFVQFGTPDPDAEPIDIPGLSSVNLSHKGSMWTGGISFYF
jgi:opacity protein-like surface antigen